MPHMANITTVFTALSTNSLKRADDKDINTKYITKDYISDAGYKPIHPTRKGYQVWLPYFEKEIAKWVS